MPDHLFVVVFALVYPVAGFVGFLRLLRKIEAGLPLNRKLLYLNPIAWHWILFVLALIVWALSGRDWDALEFDLEIDMRFLIDAELTLAGIANLPAQLRQAASALNGDVDSLQSQLRDLSLMIPRNGSELARLKLLSITAGIVEETLWRGVLIWYLSQFKLISAAAVTGAVGFGLAHSYRGLANVPRVVFAGASFSGLYLLTGSLRLPMILHGAVDLLQGRLAYDVLRRIGSEHGDAEDVEVQTSF